MNVFEVWIPALSNKFTGSGFKEVIKVLKEMQRLVVLEIQLPKEKDLDIR